MSWQAFSWHEIMEQARDLPLAERFQPAIDWTETASHEVLQMVAAFLTPLALTQGVLAFWRLGADLDFLGDFFISSGVFSHWQVWLALAIGTQAASVSLNRWLRNQRAAQEFRNST
jgi:hypothetical protein